MKLIEHKNENHQALFKLELDAKELEDMLEDAYKQLVKDAEIDGFRKGKAPRDVFERHVGKDALFDHAMKEYLPLVMDEIMVNNKIIAYTTPTLKIISRDPVVFETIVPLPPETTLGDYNSIKMKPKPIEITDNEVDEILKQAQQQGADLVATDDPAEMEDVLTMDIESNTDGEPYIVAKDDMFKLKPGLSFPVPGFSEELVGMKTGSEKEFTITCPDTFSDKTIAGKEIYFRIRVNSVRREVLPELNDDFARKLDPDSDGIAAVRQIVYKKLKLYAEEDENVEFEGKVLDALVEKSQIAFPPVLLEYEMDRMVQEYSNRVRSSTESEEEFNSIMRTIEMDKLRETYRQQAEQRVKRNLVVSKFVEEEKIEVTEDEIEMQISSIMAHTGDQEKSVDEKADYLSKPENREALRWWLAARKAKRMLVDKAKAD